MFDVETSRATPTSTTRTAAPTWRASTLIAAPPAAKLATICAVTSWGHGVTPDATTPWSRREHGDGGRLGHRRWALPAIRQQPAPSASRRPSDTRRLGERVVSSGRGCTAPSAAWADLRAASVRGPRAEPAARRRVLGLSSVATNGAPAARARPPGRVAVADEERALAGSTPEPLEHAARTGSGTGFAAPRRSKSRGPRARHRCRRDQDRPDVGLAHHAGVRDRAEA